MQFAVMRLERVANMNVKHSLTAISYSRKRVYLLLTKLLLYLLSPHLHS